MAKPTQVYGRSSFLTMTIMILGLEIPNLDQNLEKAQILDFAAAQLPKIGV